MGRKIDVDELLRAVRWRDGNGQFVYNYIIDTVNEMKIKSKWERDYDEVLWTCSCCGSRWADVRHMQFCPSCGANMVEYKANREATPNGRNKS